MKTLCRTSTSLHKVSYIGVSQSGPWGRPPTPTVHIPAASQLQVKNAKCLGVRRTTLGNTVLHPHAETADSDLSMTSMSTAMDSPTPVAVLYGTMGLLALPASVLQVTWKKKAARTQSFLQPWKANTDFIYKAGCLILNVKTYTSLKGNNLSLLFNR